MCWSLVGYKCHWHTLTELICPNSWNVHSYSWNLISCYNIKRPSVRNLQNKAGYSLPPRLTSMDPVSAVFFLHVEAYFLVSKDTHTLIKSLRSMDRWDHYVQKPLALFGLSRWWNIDGKIEIFLPATQCCPSKRVNECEDFPVSCYNEM